jgi:hypothetical protein
VRMGLINRNPPSPPGEQIRLQQPACYSQAGQ